MFNVIRKTDDSYNEIKAAADSAEARFNYTLLTTTFNDLEVGELLTFPYLKNKLATIALQLNKRGLARDVDYKLVSLDSETENGDTEEVAVLTRLSEKDGAQVETERKARGPLTEQQKNQRAASRAANKAAKTGTPAPAAKTAPAAVKPSPKPPKK